MKRTIIQFSLVASFITLFYSIALAESNAFDRNLYFGLRNNPDVVRLQEFLQKQKGGYFSGSATGNFFALTRQAVMSYQKANSIFPAAGYFGPLTRESVNKRVATAMAVGLDIDSRATLVASIQKQIFEIQKQLSLLLSASAIATTTSVAQPAITTPVITEPVPAPATTMPAVSSLPNPFNSTLKIQVLYPSVTLSSYTNATLHEFRFSTEEKIAITRLRFKNNGTLADNYITNIRLIHSGSGRELAVKDTPTAGIVDFVLKEDTKKPDNGLMVSGGTYSVTTTIITPSFGEIRPKIRLDVESSKDIEAVDFDDLTRKAIPKEMTFPIEGPQITL